MRGCRGKKVRTNTGRRKKQEERRLGISVDQEDGDTTFLHDSGM
jgi:hypothetical protein